MIANPQRSKMTAEAYLEWKLHQDGRHEFVNGEAIAMTGGTVPYNDIALNFYRALYPHLQARGCRVNVSDVKVQVSSSVYFYPDLVISCDQRDRNARKLIRFPSLIVEVLSPSTESGDRGAKFTHYRTLPTLQEYVLIDSEQVSVERYQRSEGRLWLYYPFTVGDTIQLDSIQFSCAIELLYEGIDFNPLSDNESQ